MKLSDRIYKFWIFTTKKQHKVSVKMEREVAKTNEGRQARLIETKSAGCKSASIKKYTKVIEYVLMGRYEQQ